jgi:hypothetical protein
VCVSVRARARVCVCVCVCDCVCVCQRANSEINITAGTIRVPYQRANPTPRLEYTEDKNEMQACLVTSVTTVDGYLKESKLK